MAKPEETSDAVEILRRRYVKNDPERRASVEAERVNAQVAQLIHDLRVDAGLTQAEVAELVGTTQSVISRLEDADYEGHSLSMLNRIARALNQKMTVVMTANDPRMDVLRYAFSLAAQLLRRKKNLTVDELAKRADIDRGEIVAMERNRGYRPSPLTLHKLSKFYGIPEQRMLVLAGAVKDVPPEIQQSASRFAAHSESFSKLTPEEKEALDEFVRLLRTEA